MVTDVIDSSCDEVLYSQRITSLRIKLNQEAGGKYGVLLQDAYWFNALHLSSTFLTSARSKYFTIRPHIHPFTHVFTHRRRCQPRRETASWSGAVRVRRLAQGHLDTRLGGAGDRTSNLPVTSQPAPPPEPHGRPLDPRTLK